MKKIIAEGPIEMLEMVFHLREDGTRLVADFDTDRFTPGEIDCFFGRKPYVMTSSGIYVLVGPPTEEAAIREAALENKGTHIRKYVRFCRMPEDVMDPGELSGERAVDCRGEWEQFGLHYCQRSEQILRAPYATDRDIRNRNHVGCPFISESFHKLYDTDAKEELAYFFCLNPEAAWKPCKQG